jgi:hypothetical protein
MTHHQDRRWVRVAGLAANFLAQPALRARTIGLYYLIRSLAIAPAAFVGGLLWERRPSLPFFSALVAGVAGTLLFTFTVREEHAG